MCASGKCISWLVHVSTCVSLIIIKWKVSEAFKFNSKIVKGESKAINFKVACTIFIQDSYKNFVYLLICRTWERDRVYRGPGNEAIIVYYIPCFLTESVNKPHHSCLTHETKSC